MPRGPRVPVPPRQPLLQAEPMAAHRTQWHPVFNLDGINRDWQRLQVSNRRNHDGSLRKDRPMPWRDATDAPHVPRLPQIGATALERSALGAPIWPSPVAGQPMSARAAYIPSTSGTYEPPQPQSARVRCTYLSEDAPDPHYFAAGGRARQESHARDAYAPPSEKLRLGEALPPRATRFPAHHRHRWCAD